MTDQLDRLKAALADRYTIERELGAGGMATVYLAEDLKHKRKVAVKVLRPELAAVLGAERFVQEITTTANLQHPHILPLFDSGEADGFLYYVMPYIEGETLRDKLNRESQLSIDEAVKITTEVADALDYAHRHGVIHRDIKPENILLHDGRPMVADFGIALAVSAAAGGRMTETGLSLGTPHYMSPEQATAEKNLTGRSDVYSLGAVLYEMLAGDPPHIGGTAQQIIMKIVTEEIEPVTKARRSVPPNVAAAVAKSLEKLPADRFDSAKGFADALTDVTFVAPVTRAPVARGRDRVSYWNPLSIGLAVVVVAAVLTTVLTSRRPAEPVVARHALALPGIGQGAVPFKLAIAHDGSRFAWTGWDSVWTKRRGDLDVQAFPLRAYGAALSPDGEELVTLVADGWEVRVTSLASGDVRTLFAGAATVGWGEVAWSDDGYVYFTLADRTIGRVHGGGGPMERVTSLDSSATPADLGHRVLQVLPDGRGLLLLRTRATQGGLGSGSSVAVWDLETSRATDVVTSDYAFYLPPGYLISVTADGTIMASTFDLRSLRVTSDPVPIGTDVYEPMSGNLKIAASVSCLVLYVEGRSAIGRLSLVDRTGAVSPLPLEPQGHRGVRISPDGRRLAYGGAGEIFVYDLVVGSSSRVGPGWLTWDPVWSPDGSSIAFHTSRDVSGELISTGWNGFVVDVANLAGPPRLMVAHDIVTGPSAWRSGSIIAPGNGDLFTVALDGDSGTVTPYLDAQWEESQADLSPDGRWAAYVDHRDGIPEVWVRSFPDPSAASVKVSEGQWATEPRWAADGRTLYYWRLGPELIAARLQIEPELLVESRTVEVRSLDYRFTMCCHSNYDPLPDGSGFYMSVREGGSGADMILIEGVVQELKAKVGN